jgi:hemerythrin superfamily protein
MRPALHGDHRLEENMNDPMRILKADHREVEGLLKKLADSDEGPERRGLADELMMKLSAHMETEEAIVYPSVKTNVGADDEEEAEVEHALVREGLDKMVSMADAAGFGAVVEMLKGGISHHVEEEETQILPELKEAISREEWLALGDAIAQAKQEAGLPVAQPPRRNSSKRQAKTTGRT